VDHAVEELRPGDTVSVVAVAHRPGDETVEVVADAWAPLPDASLDAVLAPSVIAGIADCQDVALFRDGEMTGGARAWSSATKAYKRTRPRTRATPTSRRTGAFLNETFPALGRPPLQQLWLDHLLALRMLEVDAGTWDWGSFALLYPSANTACHKVGLAYRAGLADDSTYLTLSLETYLDALVTVAGPGWAQDLRDRYLGRAHRHG